jgi:hypothetical protein
MERVNGKKSAKLRQYMYGRIPVRHCAAEGKANRVAMKRRPVSLWPNVLRSKAAPMEWMMNSAKHDEFSKVKFYTDIVLALLFIGGDFCTLFFLKCICGLCLPAPRLLIQGERSRRDCWRNGLPLAAFRRGYIRVSGSARGCVSCQCLRGHDPCSDCWGDREIVRAVAAIALADSDFLMGAALARQPKVTAPP